jgi:hypothetical protein
MKMNKEDMAKMDEESMGGAKPMLKIVVKAKPKGSEPETGETMAHEGGEAPDYEKSEDTMPEEGEDMGEEGMMGMSQAECDAHDLMRAAEIKMDASRMDKAMEIINKKKEVINSMEDLKAVRKAAMLKGK